SRPGRPGRRPGPGRTGAGDAGVEPGGGGRPSARAGAAAPEQQQQVERARYETGRARRQYDAVEPENRLVARELQGRWEEAWREQRRREEGSARFGRQQPEGLSAAERAQIRALAQDLPALWQAPTTTAADRQRIVRSLIEEVTVTVRGASEKVEVNIHRAGGCH